MPNAESQPIAQWKRDRRIFYFLLKKSYEQKHITTSAVIFSGEIIFFSHNISTLILV